MKIGLKGHGVSPVSFLPFSGRIGLGDSQCKKMNFFEKKYLTLAALDGILTKLSCGASWKVGTSFKKVKFS